MGAEVVVFSSLNVAEVHLVRSMLTREGIGSRLRRQFLGPLAGEIPMDDARAELLVPADRVDRAAALLREAAAAANVERPCRACGESNPGSFELCWQCGAELVGAESGGVALAGAESSGAESGGAESGGAESGGAEPGGAESGER